MAKRPEKVANLVNAIADVEKSIWELFFDFVPEDARKHLKAARKEKLLALRSILDAQIAILEKEGKAGTQKPQRVKVQ